MYIEQNSPFVYQIMFDRNIPALVVQIDPNQIDNMNPLSVDAPIIKWTQENINSNPFEVDVYKSFGYKGICENKGVIDGLLNLVFKIPPIFSFSPSEKSCPECHGTGKSNYGDGTCWHCRATGKKRISSNDLLYDLSATLSVLCKYLNLDFIGNKKPLESGFGRQLAAIDLFVDHRMNGAPIGGECQCLFSESLRDADATSESVAETMLFVDRYMNNISATPNWTHFNKEYDFKCDVREDGRFYLEVPGQNSCCVYVDRNGSSLDGIQSLSCHNVDTPWQQISLLVGFAKLWEIVSIHIKNKSKI